ncbi:hypothetical protein [Phormidium tenue]|nr:hypothetical protein [Phormidium tenue]
MGILTLGLRSHQPLPNCPGYWAGLPVRSPSDHPPRQAEWMI